MTTPIFSNKEMKGFMEIVKHFEESGLLNKVVSKTIQNEAKEEKVGFIDILLGTEGASLLGKMLESKGVIEAGEGTLRRGEDY